MGEHFLTFAVICIQVMITHRSGHLYYIGDCGFPIVEADCPVDGCLSMIGGQDYKVASGNRSEFVTEELTILCRSERSQDICTPKIHKIYVQIFEPQMSTGLCS